MKKLFYFILILFTYPIFSQAKYSGFIDKYPIELALNYYSENDIIAHYVYTNFDTPIKLHGKMINNNLVFTEKYTNNRTTATITLNDFTENTENLVGVFKNLITNKDLNIVLKKDFNFDFNDEDKIVNKEVIASEDIGNYYLKQVITKEKGSLGDYVTSVKILEKKTDKLIQTLEVDCQSWGLNSINVADFNFDGHLDFSVFESSYAGPNTSSLYFLYNPKTKTFFDSGFTGVSLEFEQKKKRIFERNQCCAGSIVTTATYKLVKNKMVLIEENCFRYDEKKKTLVKRKLKDCK
jgi:hypothetical protein